MNLLPPRIHGPVSECSNLVWVQGQLTGATVTVEDENGTVLLSDTALSGDHVFALSQAPSPGARIAARQVLGPDDSGLTPETVEVQARPAPLGAGIFTQPVFRCARCLWIDGLLPGAQVRLIQDGAVIGTGESIVGYARVGVSPALTGAEILLEQEACGAPGEARTTQPIEPPGGELQGEFLPAPVVEAPLQECRNRVTISNVVPGAMVELERSMGPDGLSCFDASSLWWGMAPPLVLGENLRARQFFRECEKLSPFSNPPVTVGPLQPVPAPSIVEPLCASGTTVRICGLLAGARVKLVVVEGGHHGLVGGQEYFGEAPEDGCFDFPVLPLPAEGVVCATQTLCGRESVLSAAAMVMEAPALLPRPEVSDPLYACSTVVRVRNLHPGTRVYVSAEIGVIGEAHVLEPEMDITVRPALAAGWNVVARAEGCGHVSETSAPVEVWDAPEELPVPEVVAPVYTCDRAVTVRRLLPGVQVDLFVNGEWAGRGQAGWEEDEIGFAIGPLDPGDQVHATQTLCDVTSEPGPGVEVTVFDGEWEVLRDGAGNVIADKTQILAVHAALLPSGSILIFSGDDYTNDASPIDNTRLMLGRPPWTVQGITGIPPGYNLFCCGHSMLADGTVLTGGGTFSRPPEGFHVRHWLGLRGSMRFRPDGSGAWGWETRSDLATARPEDVLPGRDIADTGGRWYPTLVTLPDGRVLAIGGHPLGSDARHTNTSLEIHDAATNAWSLVGDEDYDNIPGGDEAVSRVLHSEYPGLHVLPDNTVFAASSMADGDMWKWRIGDDAQDWVRVSGTPAGYAGNPQPITSVLLPLRFDQDYQPTVLLLGRQQAHVIRPMDAPTNWTPTAARPMPGQPPRIYPLATLLPTGEVLVSGGTQDAMDATALFEPEIYDPRTGAWRWIRAAANQIRNYHSVALLLPDGSIWHAGGNENCNPSGPGNDTRNRTVEIFRPWYFCWPRPRLNMVTSRVCHGEEFSVRTPDAARVTEIALVRLSSFTHAFNPDQRLVTIRFSRDREDSDRLVGTMPENPGVAVAGHYLCFVLDGNRVPSHGLFMQVCRAGGGSRPGVAAPEPLEARLQRLDADLARLRQDLVGPRAPELRPGVVGGARPRGAHHA